MTKKRGPAPPGKTATTGASADDNSKSVAKTGAKTGVDVTQGTMRRAQLAQEQRAKTTEQKLAENRKDSDEEDGGKQQEQEDASNSGAAQPAAAAPAATMNFAAAAAKNNVFAPNTFGNTGSRTCFTRSAQQNNSNKILTRGLAAGILSAASDTQLPQQIAGRRVRDVHPKENIETVSRLIENGDVVYMQLRHKCTGKLAARRIAGVAHQLFERVSNCYLVTFEDPRMNSAVVMFDMRDEWKGVGDGKPKPPPMKQKQAEELMKHIEVPNVNLEVMDDDDIPLPDSMQQLNDSNNQKPLVPVILTGTKNAMTTVAGSINIALQRETGREAKHPTNTNGNAMLPQELVSGGPKAVKEFLVKQQQEQQQQSKNDNAPSAAVHIGVTTTMRFLTDKKKENNAMVKFQKNTTLEEKMELMSNLMAADFWAHIEPNSNNMFVSLHGRKLSWQDLEDLKNVKIVAGVFSDVPPNGPRPFVDKKKTQNENEDTENAAQNGTAEAPSSPTSEVFVVSVLTGPDSEMANQPVPIKEMQARALFMAVLKKAHQKKENETGGTGTLFDENSLSARGAEQTKNAHIFYLSKLLADMVQEGPRKLASSSLILSITKRKREAQDLHGAAATEATTPSNTTQ